MGKKLESCQELEVMNLYLRMENVELRRLLEFAEKEKRFMHLQLQHVFEEPVSESSTLEATNNSFKMKPNCGHGLNTCYGSYVENDALEFSQHIKEYNYVPIGKSGLS